MGGQRGDRRRRAVHVGFALQPMTLMSIGLYNEPQGAFLPSIVD